MRKQFPFQEAQNAIVDMLHDYLAEKEHAERLEAENSILMKKTDRLMAEVERLRKAGDAMEVSLQSNFNGCPYEPIVIIEVIRRWRNAKEGKQP